MSILSPTRFGLFVMLCLTALGAQSAVIVHVGEGGESWATAIGDGRITAALDPVSSNAAQAFYTSQVGAGGFVGVESQLTPDVPGVEDISATPHDALVMSWDVPPTGANPDTLLVAAWDYNFQQQGGADLSTGSSMIHFSLNAPPGVWDVSLELIDVFGNARGWFLSMPPSVWTDYWITVNDLTSQMFDFFFQDPGFDSSQVAGIRLNESGLVSAQFPLNPVSGQPIYWNAWDHLVVVVPVPPAVLLMLPMLGWLAVRYRG